MFVACEGLPTDKPLWGFVYLSGWKVEAKYIIAKGEAVMCGEVVCGVVFVSLNICTMSCYCHTLCFALHMAVLCESDIPSCHRSLYEHVNLCSLLCMYYAVSEMPSSPCSPIAPGPTSRKPMKVGARLTGKEPPSVC